MRIETERLILRPPRESDWSDILEGASDIEVSRMLMVVPHPYKDSDAVWFVKHVTECWNQDPQTNYNFFLESKQSGKVIGSTALEKVDPFCGTAKTGSWIRRDHWRMGYILEAKIPILDFAFDTLDLRRIETSAFGKNIASQRMSEKLGFVQEGIARAATRSQATGELHDEIHYGLFKDEWQSAKKRILGS